MFADNRALTKMRTPIHQVGSALSMYYGRMSLDDIARHLEQIYNNPVTDAGVYKRFVQ